MTECTWLVAHTHLRKEKLASQHLGDQGFEIYCPQYLKTTRHARQTREVILPLFPRYLFIRADIHQTPWGVIQNTRGIAYLLMQSSKQPAWISNQIVQALKNQQDDSTGLVPVSSLQLFQRGDKIRITEGVLKNQVAIFEKYTDSDRVEILLSALGRKIAVSVDGHAIELV